ncbi:MAG: response regulator [Chloroflexi bacterium]|nr:response regulator [Chloroflexota bacterium]
MKTILVIDDDRGFRTMLSQLLNVQGWNVLEAEDGEVGLRLARERRPAVVLCDLLMPRCNGFQVCRSIREQPDTLSKTKIIVTSGSGYASDRLNALEAGADEYLLKPVKPAELFSLLERMTGAEAAPAASTGLAAAQKTRLKFWGVRGSVPTPGPDTVFYGGNTACLEVRADGELIVLDAGTGIRPLGLALNAEFKNEPITLTLLITHTHWDHIQGFPFFMPAYNPKNNIRILAFEGARKGLEATLASQMESPYFPISMQQMPGAIAVKELKDLTFEIGKVNVFATFMNHPGICVGYRLNTSEGSIAYMPDNELFQRQRSQPRTASEQASGDVLNYARGQDEKLVQFVHEADVLIIDSQYDASEYPQHVGWGHSCVDDTVLLGLHAKVKRLFLFHHDPGHDDAHISRMVADARSLVARHGGTMQVEAAREGLELLLAPAPQA